MPNAGTRAPKEPPIVPPVSPPIEDTIHAAAQDERKRGHTGFSFASIFSFTAATVLMARGQERQDILNALPKERPQGKSEEWNDGYTTAITAIIRVLVMRSMIL
jgi:hypothetical protein